MTTVAEQLARLERKPTFTNKERLTEAVEHIEDAINCVARLQAFLPTPHEEQHELRELRHDLLRVLARLVKVEVGS